MSLNRESKQAVVASVADTLNTAQTVVIAEYQGVSVAQMTELRSNARKANVSLRVLKNTLARIAVKDTKFAPLADKMSGQLVYAMSDDAIAAAKIVNEFAKSNDVLKIVAGQYNEQLLDVAAVKKLASIPGRNELLAQVMGVMQQVPASFVRAVAAIRDQKEVAA